MAADSGLLHRRRDTPYALAERPTTKVIILTTFDTDEHVFAALRAGASGFLTKEVEPAALSPWWRWERRCCRQRHAAGRRAVRPPAPPPVSGDGLAVLTAREREVVRLVAEVLSNDQIAAKLVISPLTAKTHITRVLIKLNVRDRVQLVILAYETGLVRPGF